MKTVMGFLAASLILGMQLFFVSSAYAEEGMIYACVNKNTGKMRSVDSPDQCRRRETVLSWNVEGPPGEKGPEGNKGDKGDKGDQGETGPAGSSPDEIDDLISRIEVLEANANKCETSAHCADSAYCYKPDGVCSGLGECTYRPELCPDVWDPVCGCDGKTYGNRCEASLWGINVTHPGECAASACSTNDNCASGEFCYKSDGACGDLGQCNNRPEICPYVWDPVCGCDGSTYSNQCVAAAAGVSVQYPGECSLP